MDRRTIVKVIIHSSIDLITNSSTELFVTAEGKDEAFIKEILDSILKEMGCSAVEFDVREVEDEETDEVIPNQFNVSYDYECNHAPCEHIKKMIREKLNIIEEHD